MDHYILFITLIGIPIVNGGIPGTFFWKPRLGLDLAIPTTEPIMLAREASKNNIRDGFVVLIDGYQAGITFTAYALGISSGQPFLHLHPLSAYYYTNVYRWVMRHLSLLQFWFGGQGETYVGTHKVWRRRFYYMDNLVPKWLRIFLPFVLAKEWEQEEKDLERFKVHAEAAFGKYFTYPRQRAKAGENRDSDYRYETVEQLDDSNFSVKG